MEISSTTILEILKTNGVNEIHHANSVITACQFLRKGSLLSRGSVERHNLYQTPQPSDNIDKEMNLWFDVFTDSVDIHHRAKRKNAYGPVSFILDTAIIEESYTGHIWITKCNPTKWRNVPHNERWFTSEDDLKLNFKKGKFDQMIVFRHSGGELPFLKYLNRIVLDDPQFKNNARIDLFSMALGALQLAQTEGLSAVKVEKRKCPIDCVCCEEYKNDRDSMVRMFLPFDMKTLRQS